jgi:hypothetical protein
VHDVSAGDREGQTVTYVLGYLLPAQRQRQLRASALVRGKCRECRVRKPKGKILTCEVCLDRFRDRIARRVKAKRCRDCGAKPARGKTRCARCRERHRIYDRRYKHRTPFRHEAVVYGALIEKLVAESLDHTRRMLTEVLK